MTKDTIIKTIAENIEGATQKDVKVIIDEFIDVVTKTVAKGEDVKISGFGTFSVTERAERFARNPRTGEAVIVPPTKSPKFKASKIFKDSVNA
jgi:DNA-binding protein HU-beta